MTNQEAIERIEQHMRIHFASEYPHAVYITEALNLAIEALKAQEPKSAKEMLVVGGHLMGKCPRCGKVLTAQDCPMFCGVCGQGVKWEW